jgi:anti-sigma regulatory factor (Ser/Thr protein kinase)
LKIHIPNSAFLGNIESFTSKFDPKEDGVLRVTSNQKWISVHPLIISMTIALAKEMHLKGGVINCDEFSAKSRPYLLRMGLIDSLIPCHDLKINEHESSGRFIKARQIKTSQELSEFIIDMVPLLHTTPEQALPIKYIVSELVRNVLEHSNSEIGAIVCAQYFKKTNRISIGVADRGVGIRETISNSYPGRTDKEALELALRPGITGTTNKIGGTEYNAGAGLFFTKSMAKISRDSFLLYSGSSFFKLYKTPNSEYVNLFADPAWDRGTFKKNLPAWQGTAVGINISLDLNQDFKNLLEMIGNAYQLNIKKANRDKYKRPQFI